ncbi:MAG TPA: SCO family protein [Verrucomicrobiae bacterium]|nr:SCO family protein [Verrucomicrobiae bacterium]
MKRFSAGMSAVLMLALCLAAFSPAAKANPVRDQNNRLQRIGLDQRLGNQVPLDLEFTDEAGNPVRLGQYFTGKPVLLLPVYYSCPMLCTLVMNGVVKALRVLKFVPGREFEIVAFSINPKDTPETAAKKKDQIFKEYKRDEARDGWHFLTGSEASSRALAQAAGFRYDYDATSGEYAHAAAIMVLTPEGKLSHYFFGIEYSPRDLRLALVEASKQKIGGLADQFLLLCFHYDPSYGRYSLEVMNFIRLGALATVLALAWFVTRSLREERAARSGA